MTTGDQLGAGISIRVQFDPLAVRGHGIQACEASFTAINVNSIGAIKEQVPIAVTTIIAVIPQGDVTRIPRLTVFGDADLTGLVVTNDDNVTHVTFSTVAFGNASFISTSLNAARSKARRFTDIRGGTLVLVFQVLSERPPGPPPRMI